jgi:hypothetical protein
MMKHWAIVEPLANFYRGHLQPRAKTVGGAFVSTLETSFLALDEIYTNKYPDFMSTIEEQQIVELSASSWWEYAISRFLRVFAFWALCSSM